MEATDSNTLALDGLTIEQLSDLAKSYGQYYIPPDADRHMLENMIHQSHYGK